VDAREGVLEFAEEEAFGCEVGGCLRVIHPLELCIQLLCTRDMVAQMLLM
jgi:hypothetical protein